MSSNNTELDQLERLSAQDFYHVLHDHVLDGNTDSYLLQSLSILGAELLRRPINDMALSGETLVVNCSVCITIGQSIEDVHDQAQD